MQLSEKPKVVLKFEWEHFRLKFIRRKIFYLRICGSIKSAKNNCVRQLQKYMVSKLQIRKSTNCHICGSSANLMKIKSTDLRIFAICGTYLRTAHQLIYVNFSSFKTIPRTHLWATFLSSPYLCRVYWREISRVSPSGYRSRYQQQKSGIFQHTMLIWNKMQVGWEWEYTDIIHNLWDTFYINSSKYLLINWLKSVVQPPADRWCAELPARQVPKGLREEPTRQTLT